MPRIAFLTECASGSRFFSRFLVDEGAEMSVESTIVLFSAAVAVFATTPPLEQTVSLADHCGSIDCGIVPVYRRRTPDCRIPPRKNLNMLGYLPPPPRFPHRTGCTDFAAHTDAASAPDHRAYFRVLLCSNTAARY